MNIWIGLTCLIHKLRSVVAPSLWPHEIFRHTCNMCVFTHVAYRHLQWLLVLLPNLPLLFSFGFCPVEGTDTHTLKCARTHTVLTVQWNDKYRQSHNLLRPVHTPFTGTSHLILLAGLQILFCKKLGILFSLLFSVFHPLFSSPSSAFISLSLSFLSNPLFSLSLCCLCCLR